MKRIKIVTNLRIKLEISKFTVTNLMILKLIILKLSNLHSRYILTQNSIINSNFALSKGTCGCFPLVFLR